MKIIEKPYLGLSCACVQQIKEKFFPKFFLFSDIDSKDQDTLRLVTQHFARNGLSFFVYGTTKGFHVISPDLLDIAEWYELQHMITKLVCNYYRFHVIRLSKKEGDGSSLEYFDQFYNKQHKISYQFVKLMNDKYLTSFVPQNIAEKTYLQIVNYTHHEIDL